MYSLKDRSERTYRMATIMKIAKKYGFSSACLIVLVLVTGAARAAIVRMNVQFGSTPQGDVFIELFDTPTTTHTAAPVTVANFLSYIDDGMGKRRYDGTFIHRRQTSFVIQGGGFKYDPTLGAFGIASAPHIPVDPPIINEFDPSRSNIRGRIAMAKVGGNPDSATSEWFINLADNSANLDTQNGGFTAFGQVLGDGMTIVDLIAGLPIAPAGTGGSFSALPVANGYVAPAPVTAANLVTINMVASPYLPPLFVEPAPLDFGPTQPGLVPVTQRLVTITNTGNSAVTLGVIGSQNPLAAPFSLVIGMDNCSNQVLAGFVAGSAFASCTFAIGFDPSVAGVVSQGSVDVPYDDGAPSSLTLSVFGTGALATPTLEVNPGTPIDFGTLALADFSEQQVVLRNTGTGLLQLGLPGFSGVNASDFSIRSESPPGCQSASLALAETCTLTLRFTGNDLGARVASLDISASPGTQLAQLALSGKVILSQADLVLPGTGTIDLGDTRQDLAVSINPPFGNQGTQDLIFTGFNILGVDAAQFSIDSSNCQRVAPNQSCVTTITFTPSGTGSRTATLEVQTNDPDTPVATLTLLASSSQDNDGIPDAIEAGGLNTGDGNRDGIPDSQQENVVSLPDINGKYIALESSAGTRLSDVSAINNPAPNTSPTVSGGSVTFPQGLYNFTVRDVPMGGQATVTLYMAPGMVANNYFKFGRFPNEQPALLFPQHWYTFDFLSQLQLGAEFLPDRIVLHLFDGGLGDDDQTPDGVIVDPGGPAQIVVNSSGGGGGCTLATISDDSIHAEWWLILLFTSGLMLRRNLHLEPGCHCR